MVDQTAPPFGGAAGRGRAPAVGWPTHRSMFAGSLSLGIHGGILVVLIVLFGLHAANAPRVELIPIEISEPPAKAVATGTGTRAGAGTTSKSGAIGRRGSDAPKRSQTLARPVRDPYADVVIGFDAPEAANPGTEHGSALGVGVGTGLGGTSTGSGAGFGELGDGPGIPAPPASLAQPPRPRRDYDHEQLTKVRKYAGKKVVVSLAIDAQGQVTQVGLIEGVEPSIDRQAIAVARTLEFYPALRDDGEPRASAFRWDFFIEQPRDDAPDPDAEGSMSWRSRARGSF